MTTAQVVETSVTVNNPDDQTQPTFEMTPGFKPLTALGYLLTRALIKDITLTTRAMCVKIV